MKYYFLLLIATMFFASALGQISKIYVARDGKFTVYPKHAISYDLIQKISDTEFVARTYDMKDTILMEGTYKDESLSIPNGKFSYYLNKKVDTVLNGISHFETANFVFRVGYYLNGIKTGMWIENWKRGVKRYSFVFKGDKLNGRYRKYDYYYNNYVVEEGNYVDDKKDGEWNMFSFDTLNAPIKTQVFAKNKLIKTVNHMKNLGLPKNFAEEFREVLMPNWERPGIFQVQFVINNEGKIVNPEVLKSYSAEIDKVALAYMSGLEKVTPQIYDGIPLARVYMIEAKPPKDEPKSRAIRFELYHLRNNVPVSELEVGP
ncbi:hypothetical protein [Mucilaginibacter sp.]|uniref:hypothetical protein n=1 Tax=Mucilaginibacter sp. TaxID=1882438 RepID=UPI0025E391A5|nr:hypothetical protein [Mucilaginibacter sp.]